MTYTIADLQVAVFAALTRRLPGSGEYQISKGTGPDGRPYIIAQRPEEIWGAESLDKIADAMIDSLQPRRTSDEDDFNIPDDPRDILDGPGAAELAGVSRQAIRQAIKNGQLTQVEGLPPVAVTSGDVQRWMARKNTKGGRPRKDAEKP